jgi:hypothetical protein
MVRSVANILLYMVVLDVPESDIFALASPPNTSPAGR